MKIIAGKYKMKKIVVSDKNGFQPVSLFVRENIFNVLTSFFQWKTSQILDLFAGSGSFGLEALSRGGEFCYFNDLNQKRVDDIRINLKNFAASNGKTTRNSAQQMLYKLKAGKITLDLIFLDPPFAQFKTIKPLINLISKLDLLTQRGCLVLRTEQEVDFSQAEKLTLYQRKKYGRHWVYFLIKKQPPTKTIFAKEGNHFLILSGPSGVGKKTIISQLLANPHLNLAYSLSMTTRKPRKEEKNWQDYYFVTQTEFEREIREDNFLEYAKYVNNYYGTNKNYVARLVREKKNVLFEIEIIGAIEIKKKIPQAMWIYLLPPSLEELKARIRKRNTEDQATIDQRLAKAKTEISYVTSNNLCEHYIINNDIETTNAKICHLLEKNWQREK